MSSKTSYVDTRQNYQQVDLMCFNTSLLFMSELPSSRKRKIPRVCYIPALNLRNDNFPYPFLVPLSLSLSLRPSLSLSLSLSFYFFFLTFQFHPCSFPPRFPSFRPHGAGIRPSSVVRYGPETSSLNAHSQWIRRNSDSPRLPVHANTRS